MDKYRVYMRTEKSKSLNHRVNEDRYFFSEYKFMNDEKICVLIIADGMGGLSEGDRASKNAVLGFLKAFYEKMVNFYMETDAELFSISCFADKLEKIVKDSIKSANIEVCKNADPYIPTGTTFSVICITDSYAVAANVGDSPIYMYHARTRRMKLISKLQTKAELDVEVNQYERYSSEYYANEHLLYQSLGEHSKLEEDDIYSCIIGKLEKGDMFLIGSDGAFGRMQEYEILEILYKCEQEEEEYILLQLFELAYIDKKDDQTAILYIVCE